MTMPLEIRTLLSGHEIPTWAAWLAQDADGSLWVYEAEPLQSHNGWYENEVGRRRKLADAPPPPDWRMALYRLD